MTNAPVRQDTIYALAASGDALYVGRASGLHLSTDGGQSWQSLLGAVEAKTPLAVTALAAEGKHVFAGVNGAVLRSEDGGASWQTIGLASPPPQVVALALSPRRCDLMASTICEPTRMTGFSEFMAPCGI